MSQKPVTRPEKIAAARAFINASQLPASAFTTSARDLSWTQARDVLFGLAALQYFQFDDSVYDQFTATRADDGSVTVTPPAEPAANSGASAQEKGRFMIRPFTIRGVQILYIDGFTPLNDIRRTVSVVRALDPRLLVVMAWLCEMLARDWGVTKLYHLGFLGDAAHDVNNCHNWGRAVDFAGIGGAGFNYTVLKHWGKQPVTMPMDWGPVQPKTKQAQFQKGEQYPQWPANFTATNYRLTIPPNTIKIDEADFASPMFESVYNLAAVEATDGRSTNARPTKIGRESVFIIHPDYPDPSLRAAHIDHMHIQVGPTEHAGFWKS